MFASTGTRWSLLTPTRTRRVRASSGPSPANCGSGILPALSAWRRRWSNGKEERRRRPEGGGRRSPEEGRRVQEEGRGRRGEKERGRRQEERRPPERRRRQGRREEEGRCAGRTAEEGGPGRSSSLRAVPERSRPGARQEVRPNQRAQPAQARENRR